MNSISFARHSRLEQQSQEQRLSTEGRCKSADMCLNLAQDSLSMLYEMCALADSSQETLYSTAGIMLTLDKINTWVHEAREALTPLHNTQK